MFFVRKGDTYELPPPPEEEVFERLASRVIRKLRRVYISTAKWTPERFINSFVGWKKEVYRRAWESFRVTPFSASDAIIRTFLKCEKKFYDLIKPDPVDRIISPRSPRFNFMIGMVLKAMEHPIYRAIAYAFSQTGLPVVLKGYNADAQGEILRKKFDRFTRPCVIGSDASRFDQHVSYEALRFEHKIYLALCQACDKLYLKKLLRYQLINKGVAWVEGWRVKYSIIGGRMSGDMNTGMGNSLIMASIIWDYLEMVGITKYEIVVNGDDALMMVESCDEQSVLDGYAQHGLKYGFTLAVEKPVYLFEHVEFCQTKPIQVRPGCWRMCRMPHSALAKDVVTCNFDLSNLNVLAYYCKAIGDCGGALCSGVPVFQSFYSLLRRSGRDSNITKSKGWECGMTIMAKGMELTTKEIQPSARLSFYHAFGIPAWQQVELENYYDQCKTFDRSVLDERPIGYCPLFGSVASDPRW